MRGAPAGVRRLDNLGEVTRVLGEVVALERGVNAELEELLDRRATLEGTLISLHGSTSEVRRPTLPSPLLVPVVLPQREGRGKVPLHRSRIGRSWSCNAGWQTAVRT